MLSERGISNRLLGALWVAGTFGSGMALAKPKLRPIQARGGTPTSRPVAKKAQTLPSSASKPVKAKSPGFWERIVSDVSQGRGVRFHTDDGRFGLELHLRGQVRYELAYNLPAATALHAVQLRRARIKFSGNAFGKDNRFTVQLAVSPQDEGLRDGVVTLPPLRDWYFDFTHLRDLSLRLGQYKVAFNRERVTSSSNLAFVQRSGVNEEFNLDRDMGLDLRSEDLFGLGLLRYRLGVTMGEGHSRFELSDLGVMPLLRLEIYPFGFFDDEHMNDFDRRPLPALAIGLAYAFLQRGKYLRGTRGERYPDLGFADHHYGCAEILLKWGGWSLFGAWLFRQGEYTAGSLRDGQGQPILVLPRTGHGFVGHLAFLIPRLPLEFGLRYGGIWPFEAARSSLQESHEFTGVLSYYFFRHSLKLQAEYAYLAPAALSQGEHQFRLQVQSAL